MEERPTLLYHRSNSAQLHDPRIFKRTIRQTQSLSSADILNLPSNNSFSEKQVRLGPIISIKSSKEYIAKQQASAMMNTNLQGHGNAEVKCISAQAMGVEATALCARADWVPKVKGQTCGNCQRKFRKWHHKSHCRLCGDIVCSQCSTKRIRFQKKRVRACDHCISNLVQSIMDHHGHYDMSNPLSPISSDTSDYDGSEHSPHYLTQSESESFDDSMEISQNEHKHTKMNSAQHPSSIEIEYQESHTSLKNDTITSVGPAIGHIITLTTILVLGYWVYL